MTAKQLGRGVGLERGEAVGRRVWRGDEWRCGLCVRCRSLPGMSHVAVLKGETLPPRREGLHPRTIDAPHRHMAFGPHTPLPWQPAVRSCLLPLFRISGGLGRVLLVKARGDRGAGGIHGCLDKQDLEWPSFMAFDVGLEKYIGERDRAIKIQSARFKRGHLSSDP